MPCAGELTAVAGVIGGHIYKSGEKMPIPKTIHYCWFGRETKPARVEKRIAGWEKRCPDYQIIEWNEDNYDISAAPPYIRQAYESKKWAFVTDYVRLRVVHDYGGIYMDTDVEVIKTLDPLLIHKAYFGYEDCVHIATGLGFGAEKGSPILRELMEDYHRLDRSDFLNKPVKCPILNTEVFVRHGLRQDNSCQVLDNDIHILPTEYLCPIDYQTGKKRITKNTISIHWFDASWQTEEQKQAHKTLVRKRRLADTIDYWQHMPNRIAMRLLGKERYDSLKHRLKG